MFMLKRNRAFREKLIRYLETAIRTVNCFQDGLRHYCGHGLEGLEECARTIHREESQCDRIRCQIERDLFEKSLLPEFREDIMVLLESLDLVINQAEDVLRQIVLQKIVLPAEYMKGYQELGNFCHDACRMLFEQAINAMDNDANVQELGERVEALESNADRSEHALVGQLFASNLGLAEKLHYRELIAMTGTLADLAEDAANRISVFRVKREI